MWWIIAGGMILIGFFAVCTCCCVIHSYSTVKANTTDLSDGWTETSGGWEIDSNTLRTTDTNAVLLYNQDSPSESGYVVGLTGATRTSTDTLRLYFNYVDSNNWHCVEFGGSPNKTKIIKKTSGVESDLAITDTALNYYHVCVRDSGLVTLTENTNTFHRIAVYTTYHTGGLKWGLGTGSINASGVRFSNPSLERFNGGLLTPNTDQDGDCFGCGVAVGCRYNGSPEDDDPPEEIQIEIADLTSKTTCLSCENLNGTYIAKYRGDNGTGSSLWMYDISGLGFCSFAKLWVQVASSEWVVSLSTSTTLNDPGYHLYGYWDLANGTSSVACDTDTDRTLAGHHGSSSTTQCNYPTSTAVITLLS